MSKVDKLGVSIKSVFKINEILKKIVIAVTIIVVIIIVAFFVKNSIVNIETRDKGSVTKNKGSGISSIDSYYTPSAVWGPSSTASYEYQAGNQKYPVTETQFCQIYTYENLFAENEFSSTLDVVSQVKPNINTVFNDYVNGLNHIGGANPCISEDQIYAVNIEKKCLDDNSNHNKCYDNTGNFVAQGTSISYPGRCTQVKNCEGRLGSLSLNFKIEDSKINSKTKCIGVSQIQVPRLIYNSPNDTFPDLDLSYYKEDGIIVENKTLKITDSYYPVTLRNEECNTRSARQKFLVTNYKFGPQQQGSGQTSQETNTFITDSTGIYTSIVYKPLNCYLDMEFANSGGIASIKLTSPGTCYLPNEKYSIIPFGGGSPEGTGGQVLVGVSGSNDEVGSFIISEIGSNYKEGTSVYFGGSVAYGTSATGIITSVYQTNPQIVLRKIDPLVSKFQDVKWIFMPSLDLSSQRFPIQQRCDFIQEVETSKKRYNIVSQPLEKNTVFIESEFKGNDDFKMKSNYCTGIVTQYPEITFQNLTQFGRLNPFSFYNYHVESIKGNPPQQNNPNPFKLKSNKTSRNFTAGEIFQDGTASILVTDFSKNILQFPGDYFKNTTGAVLSYFPVPPGTVTKPSNGKDIYKLSDSGLIRQVEVTNNGKLGDVKTVITGTYKGVSVLSAVTSGGETSVGTSATFDIQVDVTYNETSVTETPKIIVKSINTQGVNYNIGDILTINSSDIGLTGFSNPNLGVTETELEKFIFTSIPMRATTDSKGNNLYQLEDDPFVNTSIDFPIRDFTVLGTLTENTVNSNKLDFEVFDDIVLDRGVGMTVGYLMWMLQLDLNTGGVVSTQNFNNLVSYLGDNNLTQGFYKRSKFLDLIWISPDDVQTNQYSGNIPAPVSLELDQEPVIQFNFLQGSKMVLNPSPQQIVYGGQVVFQNLTLIEEFVALKINTVDEITNYFFTQKTNLDTDITYLKSLQYENLKYSTTNDNDVEEQTNIILGKFIPYTSFTPMRREKISAGEKIRASFENIPKSKLYKINLNRQDQLPTVPEPLLYNDNYTQFIPYGIDNVYNTNIKYKNESGSNNPFNNITQT